LEKIIPHVKFHSNQQKRGNRPPAKDASNNTKIEVAHNTPPKEENKVKLPENNTIPSQEIKTPGKISIERDTNTLTKTHPRTKCKLGSEQNRAARLSAHLSDHFRPINKGIPYEEAELPVKIEIKPTSKTSTGVRHTPTNEDKDTNVKGKNEKFKDTKEQQNDDKPQKTQTKTHTKST
jgi:hypothetical protein